jgi:hypothetical protein
MNKNQFAHAYKIKEYRMKLWIDVFTLTISNGGHDVSARIDADNALKSFNAKFNIPE